MAFTFLIGFNTLVKTPLLTSVEIEIIMKPVPTWLVPSLKHIDRVITYHHHHYQHYNYYYGFDIK